jgi:TonB-linked SusC/RagA family outer membrane protein
MRKEALINDGLPINATNAPDLFSFDNNSYTDFKKLLIGNNAHVTDAQASISGGNENTNFLISSDYHNENTVFPSSKGDIRESFHVNLNNSSYDKKFKLTLSLLYVADQNSLPGQDLTAGIFLTPNAPPLLDGQGNLVWSQNGLQFTNPLAPIYQPYAANTSNLSSNLQLSYILFSGLTLKASAGYNTTDFKELSLVPASSEAPGYSAYHFQGDNYFKNIIAEPQIEYTKELLKGKLDILAGGTFEQDENDNLSVEGIGYSSDAFVSNLESASTVFPSYDNTLYKYEALFGRINYNWSDKYIINLTGRRDGSSRFGPGRQFGNFGSIGAAWIFSNETLFKDNLSFLSFGKLRGSFGTTGSDQIGNYIYYDSWSPILFTRPYDGVSPIQPTRLFNPNFRWETDRKLDVEIDLGFFKDKINFSAIYFQNRSGNQLVQYSLPAQTGFSSLAAYNSPAVVQNTGIEFLLSSKNIESANFTWNTRFTITIPKNKLIEFPGLANSPYSNTLIIGKSLSEITAYQYLGVNPTTGLFQFSGANGPTSSPAFTDRKDLGNMDPKYYGGFYNSFKYKAFTLDVFFEGRKQHGISPEFSVYANNPPGAAAGTNYNNEPTFVLNRWQQPGNNTIFQQFTATPGSAAYNAIQYYLQSNAGATDASFIKLRTVALFYDVPKALFKKWDMLNCKIFIKGQNLLTITKYKGADPETQNLFTLPPLRTITCGIQINF